MKLAAAIAFSVALYAGCVWLIAYEVDVHFLHLSEGKM